VEKIVRLKKKDLMTRRTFYSKKMEGVECDQFNCGHYTLKNKAIKYDHQPVVCPVHGKTFATGIHEWGMAGKI